MKQKHCYWWPLSDWAICQAISQEYLAACQKVHKELVQPIQLNYMPHTRGVHVCPDATAAAWKQSHKDLS
jgi:hypothetical protein